MRKNIFLLIVLTIVPYALCRIFSLLNEDIKIGQGGNSLENHLLDKEILIEINGLYKSMDVEEYVLGVLPGTISADYDAEVLKVQAILIRTNVLKEMEEKATSDASDLSYEYLTVEDRIEQFGERNYEKYQARMEKAVVDTAGKVLRKEGSLITAFYHEVSIGKTASAKEVLDQEISYLESVDSSQDVEAKNYMNIIPYTWQELQEKVAEMSKDKEKAETVEENVDSPAKEDTEEQSEEVVRTEIKIEESTENGYVKKVSVNGTICTGEEVMKQFQLTSTNYYVEEIEGGLRFICLGKGNGLGVSQYGANRMALSGKSAEEIIHYYYKKVSIEAFRN